MPRRPTARPSRRTLLTSMGAAAAGLAIVPRHVLGGAGFTPPSEQPTRAVIGCGGMGTGHIKSINTECRLIAVSDVDEARLSAGVANAVKGGSADCKGYKDWREILDRKDVDIVHIPTPPHWHALMSIACAEAGKDIWCEKPLSRTIAEGERVVAAVNRHGRVFRLNTWFRFQSGFYGMKTPVAPIKRIVQNGLLGWPLKVTLNAHTGFAWKLGTWAGKTKLDAQPAPKGLDYDMWLGPAPYKPYHPHRVHGSFRGYWDYDGGGLGDMGQHYLDPVQYILGKDDESPVEVDVVETPPQHYDAVIPWQRVEIKYADGCRLVLDGADREKDAAFIEGPGGKLYPGLRTDPVDLAKKAESMPEPEPQITNFLTSVRTRRKFALNETNGHRSCTLVNLAKIALQLGRPLKFDPVTQRFPGDEAANRLADQPMRGQWHL
ncbi:MAG TPA: Gfo/Idh/MocA family oxidoreductase [Tepidisphaeraceae bacterium]|nr:Gfo/Idh/MocA family oxidoreductase [Tepidisphaeraceae bacterium]